MKKILRYIVLFPVFIWGQDTGQNFVKTITYREANAARPQANVMYYDGFGRAVQQIGNKQSASGKDMIIHFEYDMNRQTKEYLPYPATTDDMSFQTGAQQATLNYSQYNGQYPFREKLYENATLDRVLKQGAPGMVWQLNPLSDNDHSIKMVYQTNGVNEVKYYRALTTWNSTQQIYDIQLIDNGNYAGNELYKTITKDENWTSGTNNTTEEFKNKEGQVVLKRAYNKNPVTNSSEKYDTYYVYDIYGNLTYVIPPLVTNPSAQLNDLCFQYKYDARNRLAEKKIPGKQWEFIVYDKGNRPVATGPVFSPFRNTTETGWLITKYDGLDRVVYTGWYNITVNRRTLQDAYNGSAALSETRSLSNTIGGVAVGYSNTVFPTSGLHILTVNHYDDYNFPGAPALPSDIEGEPVLIRVKGLQTAAWSRMLTITSQYRGQLSYTLYDGKGRIISTYMPNIFDGYTQTDNKLDFMGKTDYTKTYHKHDPVANLLKVTDWYTYTDQDRPETHTHQINGEPEELIAKNTYSEIGELISKNVGGPDVTGTTGYQKIDYRYNIRGWLTDINNEAAADSADFVLASDDLFGFKINYNQVTESQNGDIIFAPTSAGGNVVPLYNGNIAETFWITSGDNVLRKYGYQYDNLNRLNTAIYQKPKTGTPIPNSYNETIAYDKNGNITSLQRTGNLDNPIFTIDMDNLAYTYNGNKLMRVNDATNNPGGFSDNGYGNTYDDYAYDANGNMTKDENKRITKITYNHLNLPTVILFSDGNKIEYIYNATGVKLQKKVTATQSSVIDYCDGFQYENDVLAFFPHAEGYVAVTDGTYYNYVFHYTDHLGNIRTSWTYNHKSGAVQIMEENHYYPFGLKHTAYNTEEYTYTMPMDGSQGYNTPALEQEGTRGLQNPYQYKFQGQERQDELGLNWDSFKWRNYDYAIGRFMSIDPLAEDYTYQSTYAFAENKVISHRELEGLEGVWFQNVLNIDKTVNPNGVGAHVMGFTQGLVNSAKGLINAVAHPVETAKGIGNVALWVAVGSQASGAVDKALGTNSTGAGNALLSGVVSGGNKLVNGNGSERGEVLGEVAGAIVGTKGAGAVSKGVGAIIEGNQTTNVFRVFGGDAKAAGFSWTTENPAQVSNFRDAAGLPSGGASGATNTGQFVLEGTVKNKNIIQTRAALPLDGNKGGLPELIIDPKNVKINRVSGVNPQF